MEEYIVSSKVPRKILSNSLSIFQNYRHPSFFVLKIIYFYKSNKLLVPFGKLFKYVSLLALFVTPFLSASSKLWSSSIFWLTLYISTNSSFSASVGYSSHSKACNQHLSASLNLSYFVISSLNGIAPGGILPYPISLILSYLILSYLFLFFFILSYILKQLQNLHYSVQKALPAQGSAD